MKPIWSPSLQPPEPQVTEAPNSVTDDALLRRDSTETVGSLLRTLAEIAIDLPARRGLDFATQCYRFAATATRGSVGRKPVLSGVPSSPPTADWTALTHFFREERQLESQQVRLGHQQLLQCVQALGQAFQNAVVQDRALDTETARALAKLSTALATGTEATLLTAVAETLPQLAQALSQRSNTHDARLSVLKRQVAELERAALLSSFSNPFERDSASGLHNQTSLNAHGDFIASVGALFDNPPVLLRIQCLMQLSEEESQLSTVSRFAEVLQAAFPDPQHFLARPQRQLFSAVIVGPSAVHAKALSENCMTELRRYCAAYPCSAALARMVAGEHREEWFQRCEEAHKLARPQELVVAPSPAQFVA